MKIIAEKAGKKFISEWIVRNVELTLESGKSYVFVGPNGSGKSTLIQLLMGSIPLSEGSITYLDQSSNQLIDPDKWYQEMVLAAPYLELVEDFTLGEFVKFHNAFKPFREGISIADFPEFIHLPHAKNKPIRHFSSGMKQRLKLGLAFASQAPVIFLDEPTSNLDSNGTQWYLDSVERYLSDRILIIGSNLEHEYAFCDQIVPITRFK